MKEDKALRECRRCHRIEYAAEGTYDKMTQPDGDPCGGRFVRTTRADREAERVAALRAKCSPSRSSASLVEQTP